MSVFTSLEYFQVALSRTQPRHTLLLHGLLSKLKSLVLREVHFDVSMAIFSGSTAWSEIDEVLSKLQSPFLQSITFMLHDTSVSEGRIEAAFPLCRQKGLLQYRLRIRTNYNVYCSHDRRRPNFDRPFSPLGSAVKSLH